VASATILNSISPVASTLPVSSTPLEAVMTLTPRQAPTSITEPSEPVSEIEIFHSNLIPDVELMKIVMKSYFHMNFTTKFSARLFEEETWLTHNVAG